MLSNRSNQSLKETGVQWPSRARRRRVGRPASPGVAETREALVRGAIAALKEEGFAGASARAIARRAGCNQGLVFYHFGSVANLLLAALDDVSETRRVALSGGGRPRRRDGRARRRGGGDLRRGSRRRPHRRARRDDRRGHRRRPGWPPRWRRASHRGAASRRTRCARRLEGSPLAAVVEPDVAAHAVVALYLGLEMLAHLDGDRSCGACTLRPGPPAGRACCRVGCRRRTGTADADSDHERGGSMTERTRAGR